MAAMWRPALGLPMQPACQPPWTPTSRAVDDAVDLPDLFEHVYQACGLPMLMLGPDGAVLGASDERRLAELAGGGGVPDRPLRERLPLYLAALGGGSPWQMPHQAELVRVLPDGRAVHERIVLRRTAWGACLSVLMLDPDPMPATVDAQTARLAALGFMVAGVCHEVTNPLTSLHSIVQILRSEQPPAPDLLRRGLDNIAINVKRILEISRRLVKFSRVGDEPVERLVIDGVVAEALHELAQQGSLRDIEVVHRPDEGCSVVGHAGQLRQVFVNLFINAVQAMGGRGRLTIDTWRAGRMTEVLVGDSGPGVPDAVAARIFEPFFTTRSATHGTGLGLSVSAEIALAHGGRLELRPGAATGAAFCLVLPHGG